MIEQLSSPSVCVVDDEEEDYTPILKALNEMFVSCVHILGNDMAKLPSAPFRRLQLLFLDLHLTNSTGKSAASHTANVFTKIVSSETAPIIVVIWSKYAHDIPDGEEETEAQLFKRTLLEAEPNFDGRLIFVEMQKPKAVDHPENWASALKQEIAKTLQNQEAIELLWSWNSLVQDACVSVGEGLTSISAATKNPGVELKNALKAAMQVLAAKQGEPIITAASAPNHLVAVLSELLTDQLEHADIAPLTKHGAWLAATPATSLGNAFPFRMNGLLVTAAPNVAPPTFLPGTVYRLRDPAGFKTFFGVDVATFIGSCGPGGKDTDPPRKAWLDAARAVLIEVSPACDVAQQKRVNALLIAGVVVPATQVKQRKAGGAFDASLPCLYLRWDAPDLPKQDVALLFCHLYKGTTPAGDVPSWMDAWFRLREMPTASLRAAHSGHAARIGYVSV